MYILMERHVRPIWMKGGSVRIDRRKASVFWGVMILLLFFLPGRSFSGGTDPLTRKHQGHPNRLIHEKSPYLLQHAFNPVDWYPWGDEAVEKARREDKPILLSIGYSTCHWCHVMERESFSDPEVASIMNRFFVCIKVDREERPDLDMIYLSAVRIMTGSSGWPLNVFLTPDLKPFYGGTYFPTKQMGNRPGWRKVLEEVAQAWEQPDQRKKIITSAGGLTERLARTLASESKGEDLNRDWLEGGFETFRSSFDSEYGGFTEAPKFPRPTINHFLLRYYALFRNRKNGKEKHQQALDMTLHTLRGMAAGGIYDQLGGGFHRYTLDKAWRVPHFEKMLCDNAQLAMNYMDAYQAVQDPDLSRVCVETLDYILREMTRPGGGFHSAQDAESLPAGGDTGDRREGAYYTWTMSELREVLPPEYFDVFCYYYGVRNDGNVQPDPNGEFRNRNILFERRTLRETAERFLISAKDVSGLLDKSRALLRAARSRRPRPQLDDKVLTAWNGLMISAMAQASQVLSREEYLQAARQAAQFLYDHVYEPEGRRLFRRWRQGSRAVPGLAEDYAFLTQGLIDLYEASFEVRWLRWAEVLTEELIRRFHDPAGGGLYVTSPGHDANLLVRLKSDNDRTEPAAASVSILNLHRLAQLLGRSDFQLVAAGMLEHYGPRMRDQPSALPYMLAALGEYLEKPVQIIIAEGGDKSGLQAMLREIHRHFIPGKILILLSENGSGAWFAQKEPALQKNEAAGWKDDRIRLHRLRLPAADE